MQRSAGQDDHLACFPRDQASQSTRRSSPAPRHRIGVERLPEQAGSNSSGVGITATRAVRLCAPGSVAGNGIFGSKDRAPKPFTQSRKCWQRQKSGVGLAEIPRRNGLFDIVSEICGLRGLGGGDSWAQTGDHPVIEPVSARAGNGNFQRRDRPAEVGSTPSRDGFGDAPETRKPPFPRPHRAPRQNDTVREGWMVADAVERNRSPKRKQGIFENYRPKRALGELTAGGHWKFRCDPRQLQDRPDTFLLFCKTGA
jgi:hypothetical protein